MAYKIDKIPDLGEICTKFNDLRSKELTYDVQIKAGKSETLILANKFILAAGSKYFFNYFYGELSENVNEISVENIEYEILKGIINYFYLSKIQITDENVRELLIAADFLQSKSLIKTCMDVMVAHLNKENVFDVWNFFASIRKDECQQEIIKFVITNISDLSDDTQYLDLTWDKIESILLSNMDKEQYQIMFGAIITWVNFNKAKRVDFFIKLITNMDFSTFDKEFLTNCIRNESLIYENFVALKIFTNAMLDSNNQMDAATCTKELEDFVQLNSIKDCLLYVSISRIFNSPSEFCSYNPRTGCKKIWTANEHWTIPYGNIVRHNNHIYKVGGKDGLLDKITGSFSSYNILSEKSESLAPICARDDCPTVVECNQKLYVLQTKDLLSYDFGDNIWSTEINQNENLFDIKYASASGSRIFFANSHIGSIDVRSNEVCFLSNDASYSSFVCFGDNTLYAVQPESRELKLFDVRKMSEVASSMSIPIPPLNRPKLTRLEDSIYIFDYFHSATLVMRYEPGNRTWEIAEPIPGILFQSHLTIA